MRTNNDVGQPAKRAGSSTGHEENEAETLSFQGAWTLLNARLQMSERELLLLAWLGPKDGGIQARELDAAPISTEQFTLEILNNDRPRLFTDPLRLKRTINFIVTDVESFRPAMRFISHDDLMERWAMLDLDLAARKRALNELLIDHGVTGWVPGYGLVDHGANAKSNDLGQYDGLVGAWRVL